MTGKYKKILVTGGNGQLAWELKIRTVERRSGCSAVPSGRPYEINPETGFLAAQSMFSGDNLPEKVQPADKSEKTFLFPGRDVLDICDHRAVGKFIKENRIDLIINCAAYTAVDTAEQEPEKARLINAAGPGILARECASNGIPLIHISTDYVFDGKNCRPYTEEDACRPVSVYGKTKLAGEKAVIKSGCAGIIVRTSWLYSGFGKNFVKTILRLASEKKSLGIVADQTGTPTFAGDLAEAILKITEAGIDRFQGEIFHYAGEGVCSWYDFARKILQLQNIPCRVQPLLTKEYPTAAVRPFYSVLDKSKIKREFSLAIPHWEDSLQNMLSGQIKTD